MAQLIHESSSCFTFLITLDVTSSINFSHSTGFIMASHCGFIMNFSYSWRHMGSLYLTLNVVYLWNHFRTQSLPFKSSNSQRQHDDVLRTRNLCLAGVAQHLIIDSGTKRSLVLFLVRSGHMLGL